MALTRFQEAAVKRITAAFLKPDGPGRFLLADEVGLGKTLVAKGVINALHEKKRNRALTVVYICSNSEIVEQNKKKLVKPFGFSTERLTLLPVYSKEIADLRRGDLPILFSFTPGTSLSVGKGTGCLRERQLLLHLLLQSGMVSRNTVTWREFFKGGCSREDWEEEFRASAMARYFYRPELGRGIEKKYIKCFRRRLRTLQVQDLAKDQAVPMLDRLEDWVRGCEPRQKSQVIGKLRECLATVCLEFIDPDLIIMDEFQRFTDTMENFDKKDTLESELIKKKSAKILILSATPYRLFSTREEDGNHYSEFYKTLGFLFKETVSDGKGGKDGPRIARIRDGLEDFRTRLEAGDVGPDGGRTLEIKQRLEQDLKQVMCRTERYWYLEDASKGVLEIPAGGGATEDLVPRTDELVEYARLQRFLLDNRMGSVAVDYWKSCPSILSFMDNSYKLIGELQKKKKSPASCCCATSS